MNAMSREPRACDSPHAGVVHAALAWGIVLAIGVFGARAGAATAAPSAATAARHAPSPGPRAVATKPAPEPSGPVIYSVRATPTIAHAGDSVKWDAHVSHNVVSVTARVAVYSFSLYPVSYGHFGEVFSIPKDVPAFFHGNYGVTITATTGDGASTSRSIHLSFQ